MNRVESLIKKYDLKMKVVNGKENIYGDIQLAQKDGVVEEIKSLKEEIVSFFEAQAEEKEKARAERKRKISEIEGLAEIETLEAEWNAYHREFDRMMDAGDCVMRVSRPAVELSELTAKYPRARAYRKAQVYAYAEHDVKASAGSRALEKIINGEDYEEALEVMESEWRAHREKHMWD